MLYDCRLFPGGAELESESYRLLSYPRLPMGGNLRVQFDYDEKIDVAIGKSVKSALRFYNELRKGAEARGERAEPPSFETFSTMAKGLMEASRQVDRDKIKNASMRDVFERTWSVKLLNYSTQRLLRETHETLMRRY